MSTEPFSPDRLSVESLEPMILMSAGVTELEAAHHDGQTFLTWQEDTTVDGEFYHIYRHNERITADNIAAAEQLTQKWGPLNDDTSVHQLATEGSPRNFVIEDLGEALSDNTGLFVYTTQDGEDGNAFYAVTLVINGEEQAIASAGDSLEVAVQESVEETGPILVNSINEGKGRVYTHFMDYKQWNPSFQGYAYNYAVALPDDYDPSQEYALKVDLHAYNGGQKFVPQTEFDWQTIQLFVDDPGADRGTTHTWWYGFAADHDYQTGGPVPTAGVIENFTEQRVLKAIDEVIANDDYQVDESRIHAIGHSMGASGALSLGIRYGGVFAGIYASQGMTDYAASPLFQDEFQRLWGTQADNLLVVNNGIHATDIAKYGADQTDATGVWNWMDHGEQLLRRRGEDIAFLMFGHGKQDTIIDWETQGRPFVAAVEAANVAYSAEQRGNWEHNWMGFEFGVHSLFSEGFGDLGEWTFEQSTSYLAISDAAESAPESQTPTVTESHNLNIDWSTVWNSFGEDIVDTAERYEISVRSLSSRQTADITPRNLQNFDLTTGETFVWQNVDNVTGATLQEGQLVVDADGLLTLPEVVLLTDAGNRIVISRGETPGIFSTLEPTPEPTDEIEEVEQTPETQPEIPVSASDREPNAPATVNQNAPSGFGPDILGPDISNSRSPASAGFGPDESGTNGGQVAVVSTPRLEAPADSGSVPFWELQQTFLTAIEALERDPIAMGGSEISYLMAIQDTQINSTPDNDNFPFSPGWLSSVLIPAK